MDYWKLIKQKEAINTGYALWIDSEFCYPCINCGKKTTLMAVNVHAHFCKLECMGEDILHDVLESKVSNGAGTHAVSAVQPVEDAPGGADSKTLETAETPL